MPHLQSPLGPGALDWSGSAPSGLVAVDSQRGSRRCATRRQEGPQSRHRDPHGLDNKFNIQVPTAFSPVQRHTVGTFESD